MRIVGVGGNAGAGKDTLADVLVKKYGFTKLAFADSLKEMCSKVFELPLNYFYDREIKDSDFLVPLEFNEEHVEAIVDYCKEFGVNIKDVKTQTISELYLGKSLNSPREVMQFIGTEVCRDNIDPNIWITIIKNTINKNPNKSYVVSDCRLPNERKLIKELDGYMTLVKRPNLDIIMGSKLNHASESGIGTEDDYDAIFNNESTLGSFQEAVELWFYLKRAK